MSLKKAQIPAILWTAFIATSCLLPASAFKNFTFNSLLELDKLVHVTLFFVFVLLWGLVAEQKASITINKKIILLLIAIAYGILIEFIQSSTKIGRSYELGDIIANTIGSIIGILLLDPLFKTMPFIKKHLPFIHKLY